MGKKYLSRVISSAAVVFGVLLVAYIFFRVGGPIPLSVTQTTTQKLTTFDVVGEGSTEVIPDQARASFGITSGATTVQSAQNNANKIINDFKKKLLELGVEEKQIKTKAYNISPEYSYEGGRSRIVSYNVTTQLEVLFKDFEKLNAAFDRATQVGANLAGQLTFELSDETKQKAEDEARKVAIEEAKRKAEKIAKDAGLTLGKIINVQENNVQEPPFGILPLGGTEVKQVTEVSPGVSEVKIQVTLSFETR